MTRPKRHQLSTAAQRHPRAHLTAEDINTAIVSARQAQALGQYVERIERGAQTILEGDELSEAIAKLSAV